MTGLAQEILIIDLGKGSKIKLIIFAEFSAMGVPPTAPSRKIINFFSKFFLLAYNDVHVVKWILYDMGNSSEYFLIPSRR